MVGCRRRLGVFAWRGGTSRHYPLAVTEQWDAFLAALRTHEAGHRDLGFAAARAVRAAILDTGPTACGDVTRRANAAGQQAIEEYNQRNAAYDRDTRHGAAQGAVWPPRPNRSAPTP